MVLICYTGTAEHPIAMGSEEEKRIKRRVKKAFPCATVLVLPYTAALVMGPDEDFEDEDFKNDKGEDEDDEDPCEDHACNMFHDSAGVHTGGPDEDLEEEECYADEDDGA